MTHDGLQKVGWYHSHPVFEVDPSLQDLVTHYQQQSNFDLQGLPFIGVIIGPYFQRQDVSSTLVNVFNLREQTSNQKMRKNILSVKERARQFHFRIIPRQKLRYNMYEEIKSIIKKSVSHKFDRPDLSSEWTSRRQRDNKLSKYQKFVSSLLGICEQNLELLETFNLESEILAYLKNPSDALEVKNQTEEYFRSKLSSPPPQENNGDETVTRRHD